MYCIYTDKEIEHEDSNREHVIPLSLGGANGFEINVSAEFNSKAGSAIDGELANCFLMMFRRQEHDARGHSKKKPIPVARSSTHSILNTPIQVYFSKEEISMYSPELGRCLTEEEKVNESFTSRIEFKPDTRIKFTAKVALSGGYFIYGDTFVENSKISELRMLMNFDRKKSSETEFTGIETKGWYSPHPVPDIDAQEHAIFDHIAKYLNCSFLLAIPTDSSVILVVCILGDLVGILNCPANTQPFPNDGDYDLGHAVVIENKKLRRLSFRDLLKEVHSRMQQRQ